MKSVMVIISALLLIAVVQAQRDGCPAICPAIYSPTCGFNGNCYRSFSSECDMASASCTGRGSGFQKVNLEQCNNPSSVKC